MASRIDLPSDLPLVTDRAARRAALLSAFLRMLNGPLRGGPIAGLDGEELPTDDAMLSLTRSQLVARPHVLRRLLAPIVIARATDDRWSPEFRQLVSAAFNDRPRDHRPDTFEQALQKLRGWAGTRYAISRDKRALRAGLRVLDPEELLDVEPSFIESENGVFRVGRRAWVKAPLDVIRDAINPVNWGRLGEYFEYVGRVEETVVERDDEGWSGVFEERYVFGWGPLTLATCHPFLMVDFTYDETRVRADYSLLYEENDLLECDNGYLEAKTAPGRNGWCEYYSEKSTQFRLPTVNLLAPVILAVYLESSLSSIEDAAYDHRDSEAGARASGIR